MIAEPLSFLTEQELEEYRGKFNPYFAENPYWYVFCVSKLYGSVKGWAFGHLKELVPDLQRPTKKLDPKYSGEYDFLLDWMDKKNKIHNIRIEIKTSRAVDFKKPDEPLYVKALSSDSKRPFDMNFQQIKTRCSDIFIWIAVWRDKIRYWVLNSDEVKKNKYFSKGQHRGNVGEGQLYLNQDNISEFKKYEVNPLRLDKQ